MNIKKFITIGWALAATTSAGIASAATPHDTKLTSFKDSHISVDLIADRTTVEPGGMVTVGVQFSIEEGWHIYWKNPGQSGLPTRITGAPIEGVSYDPVQWPLPSAFQFDGLVNYGYEQKPLFLQTVHFAKENRTTPINMSLPLTVSWVLCRDECIPGETTLSLNIENGTIPNSLVKPSQISGFSEGRSALLPMNGSVSNGALTLSIAGLNKGIQSAHYAPALTDLVDPSAVQTVETTGAATPTVVVPLLAQPDSVAPVLDGVLFLSYTDGLKILR